MPLTLGSKRGFYTLCLNAILYRYPIISIFRPTTCHWILTLYSSWKALNKRKQIAFKGISHFQFSLNENKVLKVLQTFLHI